MPATVDTEVIKNAVQLACRAPSLHNSQPWQWVADGDQLHLYLDRSRAMLSDRSAREALISCGAVLDHLQVAMAAAGWRSIVDRFPSPNDTEHLASIRFTAKEYASESHRRRASAIWARRTDRLPFNSPMDWESIELALRDALESSPVHLNVMADDVRQQLAEASRLAESLRVYDSSYHAELGWWTAPYEVSEGIPRSALVSAAEGERVDVGRVFPSTRHLERRPQVPEDHSMIVVLSTDSDSAADALASGEALSAVLLECALAGLATCPVTHITEVRPSRDLVGALLSDETVPQVLIRLGIAPAIEEVPPPTPRRPLDEVLRIKT
jgi:nitroreductase